MSKHYIIQRTANVFVRNLMGEETNDINEAKTFRNVANAKTTGAYAAVPGSLVVPVSISIALVN